MNVRATQCCSKHHPMLKVTPMVQYLKIVSKSITTPEDMFTLGVSTSRGKVDKIGQFGSGSLMGVLAWMREFGDAPKFVINGKKVSFSSKPVLKSDGEVFHQVLMNRVPLSVALEYGELDWKTPELGLREWICNALDAGANLSDALQVVNNMSTEANEVAVFLPFTGIAKRYYQNIDTYFLHFRNLQDTEFIPKNAVSPCRIYRKGIFVRELQENSLFDYNLHFDINECRTGSSDSLMQTIEYAMLSTHNTNYMDSVFKAVLDSENCIEVKMSAYTSVYGLWSSFLKDQTVKVGKSNLEREDVIPVMDHWYKRIVDVAPHLDGLANISLASVRGLTEVSVPTTTQSVFNELCSMIEILDMTGGKNRPNLETFSMPQGQRPPALGYYDPNRQTVLIWNEAPNDMNTLTHELGHHYSGGQEWSKVFIDFGYELFARMIKAFKA
jgi:hypothetical protein